MSINNERVGATTTLTHKVTPKKPECSELTCERVFQVALKGLFTISEKHKDPKFMVTAEQLNLWGAGMFEGPLALDTIFEHNEIARKNIHQFFMDNFAEILVAEGESLINTTYRSTEIT